MLVYSVCPAQAIKFAFVSDSHIGNPTAQENLVRRTIADINANPNLALIVVTAGITEIGSDEELKLVKQSSICLQALVHCSGQPREHQRLTE